MRKLNRPNWLVPETVIGIVLMLSLNWLIILIGVGPSWTNSYRIVLGMSIPVWSAAMVFGWSLLLVTSIRIKNWRLLVIGSVGCLLINVLAINILPFVQQYKMRKAFEQWSNYYPAPTN